MDASPRWHSWVASHPVGGLAVTGLVATQIVTYLGYCFKAIGLPTLPWPAYNGALIGGADTWASPLAQYWAGQSMHYVNGIVFTILFGMVARAKLPGSHVIKGVLYGVVLAIVSVGFLVPYAYVRNIWLTQNAEAFRIGPIRLCNNPDTEALRFQSTTNNARTK